MLLLHVVVPTEAEWCVSQTTRPQRTWTKLTMDTTTIPQPAKSVLSIWRRTHSIRATYRHGTHRQAPQRRSFALGAFVKVSREDDSTKLQAQIADEQQQRNAELPPLGALVVNVDVGDREVGADGSGALRNLPVTTMPSAVYEEHLPERGTWIDVHVKSRAKVSLSSRTAQWCWVATWTFSAMELPVTKLAAS